MSREEDYETVRYLRSSDPAVWRPALDILYRKYKDKVFNLAARVLRDRNLAADAVQGTFLTVLRKAHKFRFRAAFSSWLYRVTVNRCIDLKRRSARNPRLSLSEPEVGEQVGDQDLRRSAGPSPLQEAERSELRGAIEEALGDLDPRMAAVVVLRYMEGLDYQEIAHALGVPLGTIKSRLNRAHAALVERLGHRLDEEQ